MKKLFFPVVSVSVTVACSFFCLNCRAATGTNSVSANIDGTNIVYRCVRYSPADEIKLFSNKKNRTDTAYNVVVSQFTQMHVGNWNAFIALWDDFYAPYKKMGIAGPRSDAFTSAWAKTMPGTRQYIKYRVILDGYVLFVVDSVSPNGTVISRTVSTVKRDNGKYKLTHELSLRSNALEQVLDDPAFDPVLGRFKSVTISGDVEYKGIRKGFIHVVIVRASTMDNWRTNHRCSLSSSGRYTVNDIVPGYSYVAKAYLDADSDGNFDDGEPIGYFSGNPFTPTQDVSNVDIILVDRR